MVGYQELYQVYSMTGSQRNTSGCMKISKDKGAGTEESALIQRFLPTMVGYGKVQVLGEHIYSP